MINKMRFRVDIVELEVNVKSIWLQFFVFWPRKFYEDLSSINEILSIQNYWQI